jgi:pimeloyl-ACP methyl ester carboxylesterase
VAAASATALLAGACSSGNGGDSGSAADDPTDPVAGSVNPGERNVQFVGAGRVRLSGTLTVPPAASGANVPGVLIVPNAGKGDRNGLLSVTGVPDGLGGDIAQKLSDGGAASYRYDRRGTGESRIEPDVRLSFDDLVADARAGLDLLAQRRETAGRELTVVGYDSGGLVALRLATSDDRVKRLVLISTPGQPLVEMQAAQLAAQYGPESADALRSTVASLLVTRSLPPADSMRAEIRELLPPNEAGFLADLYAFDPATEAAKVKVSTMLVLPRDTAPYAPAGFSATPRLEVVNSPAGGPTLLIEGPPPTDDRANPASPTHEHGAGPAVAATKRDGEVLGRIAAFVTARS